MTAIWQHDGTAWSLLAPSGFPDEATLHGLVEDAPHTLPLAGNPSLVMLGREVRLGRNRADLIAVERTGRLAIIEIKLAYNPEARSAVISQILTYAAYLRGLDVPTLEREILGEHLRRRNYDGVAHAVEKTDQEGTYDPDAFGAELAASLAEGRFRLVIVLDDAPEDLVSLVGYLGAVSNKLVIDLVTVSAYAVGDTQVIVPQRVEPERREVSPQGDAAPRPRPPAQQVFDGAAEFAASIEQARADQQPLLRQVLQWAVGLEQAGLARLGTYHGKGNVVTLLPRLPAEGVGMVTVFNAPGGASLRFWRGVIERRAPRALPRVEAAAAPATVGQGSATRTVSDDLLEALTAAYREAAGGHVVLGSDVAPANDGESSEGSEDMRSDT